MPTVMPLAKVRNATLRLLVMMALEATGLMATMECVHISRRSIVSTMRAPSTWCMNCGWKMVSSMPASAAAANSPKASAV